jgi:hypothetical protein
MVKVGDKTILEKFTADFIRVVEKYAKYIIVSGLVAILHGRSRGTEDIDIIIERIDLNTFTKLHKNLLKNNFECLQSKKVEEIYKYLKDNLSVRYIKKGYFVPQVELRFAKDELDNYQLKTRKKLPFTGTDFYFSSIEMNIAFKEELLKSDKDLEDARHLRIIYSDKIDESEIEKIKKEIRRLRL